MVGAHTDSPCLVWFLSVQFFFLIFSRKSSQSLPKPYVLNIFLFLDDLIQSYGYNQVGVELYGGGLWYTWFDRDLTVGGRVLVQTDAGGYESRLVYINKPILRVPSLAIHLDRTVNTDGFKFNQEVATVPVLETAIKSYEKKK